jgi:CTP:phosphocholine cytidylyltransferase-like protein
VHTCNDGWINGFAASTINQGITKVYAENALNDILHKLSIVGMSYKDDYIEEIDNQEDYDRVNKEIELFDIK